MIENEHGALAAMTQEEYHEAMMVIALPFCQPYPRRPRRDNRVVLNSPK